MRSLTETPPRRPRGRLGLALIVGAALVSRAAADDAPASPRPSSSAPADGRHRIVPPPKIGRDTSRAATSLSTGGWWLGTAGVALALAAFGGASVAARRLAPRSDAGPLRVIGRTSLSPRHSVYLLRAGDRVLIVGTGPGGSPSLLGEMEPDEVGPVRAVPRPLFARTGAGGGA